MTVAVGTCATEAFILEVNLRIDFTTLTDACKITGREGDRPFFLKNGDLRDMLHQVKLGKHAKTNSP